MHINELYYLLKLVLPRRLQVVLRRWRALRKRKLYKDTWPIDQSAGAMPNGWRGWPEEKQFALVLTHDVETCKGKEKCYQLMELEKKMGFRSSFYFVAEDYDVPSDMRDSLTKNGFEVGIHGLRHQEKLFSSKRVFKQRASVINKYLNIWGSVGFRAPSMYHNLEWIHLLNIEHDASTFDTDPFEPQPDGMKTIFPFWVQDNGYNKGYVELPYTLPQDFTLFIILLEKNTQIWKSKLDWIAQHGGMALLITHPDYMNFGNNKITFQEYPAEYYEDFLNYIITNYQGKYWNPLPREMASFWSKNHRVG
jgi:hypothetical protein